MPELKRILVLHFSHLSNETLNQACPPVLASNPELILYLVPQSENQLDALRHEVPSDLRVVLSFAYRRGADYVLFDQYGQILENLPVHNGG